MGQERQIQPLWNHIGNNIVAMTVGIFAAHLWTDMPRNSHPVQGQPPEEHLQAQVAVPSEGL